MYGGQNTQNGVDTRTGRALDRSSRPSLFDQHLETDTFVAPLSFVKKECVDHLDPSRSVHNIFLLRKDKTAEGYTQSLKK